MTLLNTIYVALALLVFYFGYFIGHKERKERSTKGNDVIRVGDELRYQGIRFVVTHCTETGIISGMWSNGEWGSLIELKDAYIYKTGRHFSQIEKVLKKMQDDIKGEKKYEKRNGKAERRDEE